MTFKLNLFTALKCILNVILSPYPSIYLPIYPSIYPPLFPPYGLGVISAPSIIHSVVSILV